MPKRQHTFHDAFTLIEVMVAVMIVSVVIAALLQMRGETTHKFFGIKKMMQTNQYNSFLIGQGDKYGFEKSSMNLNRLVENFDLESDLRRELKSQKVSLLYEKLKSVDTSEYDGENSEKSSSGTVFEIGKSTIEADDFRVNMIRVRAE